MQRRTLIRRAALAALMPAGSALPRGAALAAAADDSHAVTRHAVSERVSYSPYESSDGSTRWMTASRRHSVANAASDLQLVFGNLAQGKLGAEIPGPNPIAVTVQLEYPHGVIHDVLFRGQPTVTIESGALIASDPLDLTIPDGGQFQVTTNVAALAPPYQWPLNCWMFAAYGDWLDFGTGENCMFTRPEMPHWNALFGYGPFNILGRTSKPQVSVAVIGDSVTGHELGFATRPLSGRIAWFNCSLGGDSLTEFVRSAKVRIALIQGHFTHAICSLGIAEIRAGGDEAMVRQRFTQMWDLLHGLGLKVFQTTITPWTASTDQWRTDTGQTRRLPNFIPGGLYQRINQWIRSVPPPLTGCFDASAVLDSSVDSGLWTTSRGAPVTSDGAHPNDWGQQIGAACIDVGQLRL
jgi:hypothetical protein